jgi:Protein of unknown function (DUF998)
MYNGFVNVNRNAGIISSEVTATRAVLGCSVAAGPLFLLTLVIQALVRPEFRFTRSELSVLSIGPLGWIQIVDFAAWPHRASCNTARRFRIHSSFSASAKTVHGVPLLTTVVRAANTVPRTVV